MKFFLNHPFLINVFLSLFSFKAGFACINSTNQPFEDPEKFISVIVTSQIRTHNCKLDYLITFKDKSIESNSIFISRQTGNIRQVTEFRIKKYPISYISLILYNKPSENKKTDEDIEATALALFHMKAKIRTFEKIYVELIETDHINILLNSEYYLPPSFNIEQKK